MAMEQGHSDLLAQVQEIVCVGGAFEVAGDLTAAAERNVGLRPEDFHNFIQDFSNPVIVPKDVEEDYTVSGEMLTFCNDLSGEKLDDTDEPHPVVEFLSDLLRLLAKKQSVVHQPDAAQVHALAAVAYYLCPQHLSMRRAPVRIWRRLSRSRHRVVFAGAKRSTTWHLPTVPNEDAACRRRKKQTLTRFSSESCAATGVAPNAWVVNGGDGAKVGASFYMAQPSSS
eukprot:scaffold109_cov252-Pinguiococcus_pyrenoidosus.AAC.75